MILQGLRVVELGQILSAPFAGAIFADLGAEVIKAEKPDGGDDGRQMGPAYIGDMSLTFQEYNRGKKSTVIDIKSPSGRAKLDSLLADADIFIHNLRPDVPEKYGVDPQTLTERHPHLIYAEISGFGHLGPLRSSPAFEPLIQAYSGLISINGDPAGPPSRIGVSAVDLGTAMWCVIGCLAALRERDKTGRGTVVRTSLFETGAAWAAQRINALVNAGMESPRQPNSGHPGIAPYQSFETADDPIFIAAGTSSLFEKLCDVLGHPEWKEDSRFENNRMRLKYRTELVGLVQQELRLRTRAEWLEAIGNAGVPCSPINSIAQLIETEQFAAQQLLQDIEGLPLKMVATPIWFGNERAKTLQPAPELGELDELATQDH